MKIKPDTTSVYYDKFAPIWSRIAAIMEGEDSIKAGGEKYLPKLTGQTPQEYERYLQRGTFFNAYKRTIVGLTGAIMQVQPMIETDKSILDILQDATLADESIDEVIKLVTDALLSFGYYGILVDMPNQQTVKPVPYFALYNPLSILNFHFEKQNNEYKLTQLTLLEQVDEPDPENMFGQIIKEQVRLLILEEGKLVVRLYRRVEKTNSENDEWMQEGEDIFPVIRGQRLDYIPFIFFGAVTNNPVPSEPPLGDLSNLNIKHWQVSVDYYHGLHFCAIPTPWAAGFDIGIELKLGGETAWVTDNPDAKCGFLEFTGSGIAAIEKALERLERMMAILGARLLEEQKRAAEAADTVKMRYASDTATLSSIVTNVEQGIMKAIILLGKWLGLEIKVEIKLNRDFVSERLSAQDILALLQAWQQGGITQETFLYNLQAGEILSPETTIEDEIAATEKKQNEMMEKALGGFSNVPPKEEPTVENK